METIPSAHDIRGACIEAFMENQMKVMPEHAEELRQLRLMSVSFFDGKEPARAEVQFDESPCTRRWGCSFHHGKFSALNVGPKV
jgi:hypothetical protein